MSPFNTLTENDKKLIENYIRAFGAKNELPNTKMASMAKILSEWNNAKNDHLFKMFGEQLILEYPVLIEKSESELLDNMYTAFREKPILEEFYRDWANILSKHFEEDDVYTIFGKTYHSKKPSDTFWDLDYLIQKGTLVSNVCEKSFDIPTPDGNVIQARPGMKLIRLIGKIATAFNIPNFEDFRIAHSMVLNDKKLKGNLCLSIHPMDYMTMSDNDSRWSSCMSWQETGDYRAGTIEMMNSPRVVVAYLKGEEDMKYYARGGYDTWNNKKWRCLFVVDEDIIFHVKNYPYHNIDLTDQCLLLLKELAENNLGYQYDNKVFVFDSFNKSEYKGKEIEICPSTEIMYNDCSRNQRSLLSKNFSETKLHINFSGAYTCMWCGEYEDVPSDGVFCYECEQDYRCSCCGQSLNEYERYEHNGDYYCEDCYYDMFYEDKLTGEDIHESEFVTLYLFKDDESPNDDYMAGRCASLTTCRDSMNTHTIWDSHFSIEKYKTFTDRWGSTKYYVTIADCKKYGLDAFEYSSAEEAFESLTR